MDDKGILYNNECEFKYVLKSLMGLPGGSVVKNMPAKAGHVVSISGSLGQEDPQEAGMATHSSILAWRIAMGRGAWQAIVHRVAKSQTQLK